MRTRKPKRSSRPGSKRAEPADDPPPSASDGQLPARLLASTTEILAANGVAAVSLRAVARHAGVSHGAPGYHFRSKAGLLAAYAADGFRRMVESVGTEMVKAGPDPRKQLAAIGKAYIFFALEHRDQFGVMFRRDMHGAGDPALEEASSRAFGALHSVLSRASAAGYLPKAEIETASAAAWSVAHGLAVLLLEGRLPARIAVTDPKDVASAAIDFFVRSIMPEPPAPRARR